MSLRQWYRVHNAAEKPTSAEIVIYGPIGASFWDDAAVSAKQFIDDLKALGPDVMTITVRVNSPGGDAFDGTTIANALRTWASAVEGRTVDTVVDGLAASAASVIVMAGNTVRMSDNAILMIHNPYTLAVGDARAMRKTAEALDTVRDAIVATYRWHSSLEPDAISTLMDDETWMDADTAIANGFATDKVEGLRAAACLDAGQLSRMQLRVPEQFKARVDALVVAPQPEPAAEQAAPCALAAADVLRLCTDAGVLDIASELVTAQASEEAVQARIAAAVTARRQASERSSAIDAICATAKLDTLAPGYVRGGMSVADVQAHVTTITARLDQAAIDTNLDPDAGQKTAKARISTRAVYAGRNQ